MNALANNWLFKLLAILAVSVLAVVNAQQQYAQSVTTKGLITDGELVDLNEDNWHLMLKGEWMIEFFAPWCPACKNLAPTWERFAKTAKDLNVNVAKIDVTTSPSLSGRFFVTALPTIYHVKNGEFRQYRGSRDGDALQLFVKKQQWQKIDPISAWKKPDTIHMSILSYFFKLSHTLKDFNGRLQEEYGLPTWGSYALFAIATIFVGAALGLVLVCIVDFVYPPKKAQRQSFSESQDNLVDKGIEDLAAEDIEDDAEEDDEDDDQEDEEEEDQEDDEEDEAENSTSEGEKNSHSESETAESEHIGDVKKLNADKTKNDEKGNLHQQLNEQEAAGTTANNKQTTEVRKRKPRKGD